MSKHMHGITPNHYKVLQCVLTSGQPQSTRSLSESMCISTSTAAHMVKALLESGYIEPAGMEGARVYYTITTDGESALNGDSGGDTGALRKCLGRSPETGEVHGELFWSEGPHNRICKACKLSKRWENQWGV